MTKAIILTKAMGLFVADGRLLVSPGFDSVKREHYFRLLGGSIEFGEKSEETLRREILEEVGAAVEVLHRLDVVENLFTFEGLRGHEIAFILHARFLDKAFTRRDELENIEPGRDETYLWRPIGEVLDGPVPLYPEADYTRLLSMIGIDRPY